VLLDVLRPKPFRGDVVAAGVVVLATLVWVVEVRFADTWGDGVHLAYATLAWAFVTAMAVLAPMEGSAPRAYQSVLYVASFALAVAALGNLAAVLGADGVARSPGAVTWVAAVLAAQALVFATWRNSAVCTLLGALSGGIAVLAFFAWAFDVDRGATFRWILLALVVVYVLTAVGQRDRHFRHGVALIDCAGLATAGIAVTFAGDVPFLGLDAHRTAAWGWELLVLAVGFGLIAYSSVDRAPGPAYLGVLNLAAFAVITSGGVRSGGATLLGWPLVLAAIAAFLLIVGLRPTTPAPPPPDADAPEAPPLPLR
jgi:hypothetical protein